MKVSRFVIMSILIVLLAYCSSEVDRKSDRNALIRFAKEIAAPMELFDNAYEQFSGLAKEDRRREALAMGKKMRGILLNHLNELRDIQVPLLSNKDRQRLLEEAKADFIRAYENKIESIDMFTEYARNPNSASLIKMQRLSQDCQDKIEKGLSLLNTVGSSLR